MTLPVASYTFLNTWDICNHQAFRKFIAKDLPKEPQSPEMIYGNDVHDAMEKRLDRKAPLPLVDRFAAYEPFVKPLLPFVEKGQLVAEQKLGMDANGAAVGFWDGSTWLRGKLDAPVVNGTTALLLDWKTGKAREDPYELEIGALLLQAKYPCVTTVLGRYVWLKEMRLGETHDCSDTRRTFESVHKTMDEVGHAIKMDVFPKKQGPLCGWCPVLDCQHNRRGK